MFSTGQQKKAFHTGTVGVLLRSATRNCCFSVVMHGSSAEENSTSFSKLIFFFFHEAYIPFSNPGVGSHLANVSLMRGFRFPLPLLRAGAECGAALLSARAAIPPS